MSSNHLIIQNQPGLDKKMNLDNVNMLIENNINISINFIILPECFNSPYGINYFKQYAEELIVSDDNPTVKLLHTISTKYPKIYLIGGSIPVKENDKYYNTCTVWYNGNIVCTYKKIHLFDISIPNNGIFFQESQILSPGTKPVFFDTEYGRVGLGICFDLRFNTLSNYYAKNNCDIIVYPGSFTQYTGTLHWELLLRARAVDSQCWIIGVSTALNNDLTYKSYGHSMVVDNWGRVCSADIGDSPNIIIQNVNISDNKNFQSSIPIKNVIKPFI